MGLRLVEVMSLQRRYSLVLALPGKGGDLCSNPSLTGKTLHLSESI